MSLVDLKNQIIETIKRRENVKSELDKDKKVNIETFNETDRQIHLRDLGQKTAQLVLLSKQLDDLKTQERLEKKRKKLERHKVWKRRHKVRVQKQKRLRELRNAQWIKDVQWEVTMAPSVNDQRLKKRQATKAKKEQHKTEDPVSKADYLKEFLACLVELRSLRRKKLEAKGHFFPDDGDQFFNQVKESEATDPAPESNGTDESDSADELPDKKEIDINEEDTWSHLELDKNAYQYWCKADQSLDALLAVRRSWDQYIENVPSESAFYDDVFHKIPPTFVSPSPPANGIWASYLA